MPLLEALTLAQAGVRAPGRRARLEEVSRNVRAGGTLADSLEEQSTLTATGTASGSIAKDARVGGLTLRPTVAVDYYKLKEDGYAESGGYSTAAWNAGITTGKVIERAAPILGLPPRFEPPVAPFPLMARLGAWGTR